MCDFAHVFFFPLSLVFSWEGDWKMTRKTGEIAVGTVPRSNPSVAWRLPILVSDVHIFHVGKNF